LVEAVSVSRDNKNSGNTAKEEESKVNHELIQGQRVEHAEDEIRLERIKFEDESKNRIQDLTILDQAILLACAWM
jgi:hypothetical protein